MTAAHAAVQRARVLDFTGYFAAGWLLYSAATLAEDAGSPTAQPIAVGAAVAFCRSIPSVCDFLRGADR